MPRRVVDGPDRIEVKILHVDDLADLALFEKLHHRSANAADCPAHFDVPLVHVPLQKQVHGKRRSARARLEGKAVFEIRRRRNDLCRLLRHHKLSRVLRHAQSGGGDFSGVSDRVDHHDRVDVDCLNGRRHIREIHEAVRYHDHVICKFCVRHCVAHRAAVALTADAAAVSHAVARRRGYDSNVDMYLARLNRAGSSAVAADDRGRFELSLRDDLAHAPADAGGLDADDFSLLDVIGNRIMRISKTRCGNREILEPQLLYCRRHGHACDIVAVS